jgi:hypothetical protein
LGVVSGVTLDSRRVFTKDQKDEFVTKDAVKDKNGIKCQCAMCKELHDKG